MQSSRFFLVVLISTRIAIAASPLRAQSAPPLTDAEILQRIDAAVLQRSNTIARYTVQEHYALYRNAETTPAAEETVQTVYTRATGKEYTPIAQSGSALLRSLVIDKLIAGEKEINLAANRQASWLISANYEMSPEHDANSPASANSPAIVDRNGRHCYVIDIKPRHKSPHLFNGKIWIDTEDFAIDRLEGSPSQNPSIFAGDSTVSRDYGRVDGFSMATHAEGHSHSFLAGDNTIKIDYTGYKIDLVPDPAPSH